MEEREGYFKSYDSTTKKATLSDVLSGGTIIADDPGLIIGPGGGPPVDTIIYFITIYIPPRAGQTERIINILKNIKA